MNIEAVLADGEECPSHSEARESEREDTFVVMSTAASIKEETGGGARLPSAISLPF